MSAGKPAVSTRPKSSATRRSDSPLTTSSFGFDPQPRGGKRVDRLDNGFRLSDGR